MKNFLNVIIVSGIESIGKYCFSGSHAETVEIKNSSKLQTIRDNAFSECKQLKFLKIPSNVERIGKDCFRESNVEIKNNSKL